MHIAIPIEVAPNVAAARVNETSIKVGFIGDLIASIPCRDVKIRGIAASSPVDSAYNLYARVINVTPV